MEQRKESINLPVLLSIPHGGTKKPPELKGHLCISEKDLFDDIDPFVIDIYDLGNKVKKVVKTHIARTFVDLNRSPHEMPPENPDGLIKSSTCYQKPIYIKGREPDDSLRSLLMERYYYPYHKIILQSVNELDLQLCLDCHSMASSAPNISPDGNEKKRPLFCLSNQDGKTCSNEMISHLAECISKSYFIDRQDISINDPFQGGYITKTYGNNPIPWIQVEMNRKLYLTEPWFDTDSLSVDNDRLKDLNKKFQNSLELFFTNLKKGKIGNNLS